MTWQNLYEGDIINVPSSGYYTAVFTKPVAVKNVRFSNNYVHFKAEDDNGDKWNLSVNETSDDKIEVVSKSSNINYSLNFSEWKEYVKLVNLFSYFKEFKDYEKSDNIRKELILWQNIDDKEFIEMVHHQNYSFNIWCEEASHSVERLKARN